MRCQVNNSSHKHENSIQNGLRHFLQREKCLLLLLLSHIRHLISFSVVNAMFAVSPKTVSMQVIYDCTSLSPATTTYSPIIFMSSWIWILLPLPVGLQNHRIRHANRMFIVIGMFYV